MYFKLSIFKCSIITLIWYLTIQAIQYGVPLIKLDKLPIDVRIELLFDYLDIYIVCFFVILFLKKKEKIVLIQKTKNKYFLSLILIAALVSIILDIVMDPIKNIYTITHLKDLNFNNIVYDFKVSYIKIVINVFKRNPYHFIEFLTIIFVGPFVEEIVFRRYFFVGLLRKYNLKIALIISSLLFAIMHAPSIKNIIITFIFGLISAYIYYSTSNIIFPLFLHIIKNIIYYAHSIFIYEYMKLLNYHKFGISYWIVILLLTCMLIYFLYLFNNIGCKSLKNISCASALDKSEQNCVTVNNLR